MQVFARQPQVRRVPLLSLGTQQNSTVDVQQPPLSVQPLPPVSYNTVCVIMLICERALIGTQKNWAADFSSLRWIKKYHLSSVDKTTDKGFLFQMLYLSLLSAIQPIDNVNRELMQFRQFNKDFRDIIDAEQYGKTRVEQIIGDEEFIATFKEKFNKDRSEITEVQAAIIKKQAEILNTTQKLGWLKNPRVMLTIKCSMMAIVIIFVLVETSFMLSPLIFSTGGNSSDLKPSSNATTKEPENPLSHDAFLFLAVLSALFCVSLLVISIHCFKVLKQRVSSKVVSLEEDLKKLKHSVKTLDRQFLTLIEELKLIVDIKIVNTRPSNISEAELSQQRPEDVETGMRGGVHAL